MHVKFKRQLVIYVTTTAVVGRDRVFIHEPDLADDMEQEGLVALWRLALANTTGRYIYPAIMRHMLKYRRVELKSRVISPVRRHYKRKEQGY